MQATERLAFQRITTDNLDAFHSLVQDEHVRRYLMDGEVFPREWSADRIRESEELHDRRGVGLWLVRLVASNDLVGFCGFLVIPSVHHAPQLVYALFERFTGQGYATEMARAAVAHARQHAGFAEIVAAVDEINTASCHVLDKLGFELTATTQGSFGNMLSFRLRL
jgi:ribosomal-protein-alanine N-acetyltransferase